MSQIDTKFIKDNAVNEAKVRLSNDAALRARNNADNADVEILKVNASDKIQFLSVPQATADAAEGNDLVRKSQLDTLLEGLKPKEAVRAATTANIALSGGASLTIDDIALANDDRILLKDQTSPSENGIYVISGIGSAYSLTRATDFDQTTPVNEIEGSYVVVQEGTANAGKGYVQQGTVATIDTDAINFVLFKSTADLTPGDGIDIAGTTVSVDLKASAGLKIDATELAVEPADFAGTGLEDDGADNLRIASSAAGNGLQGGSGSALAVQADVTGGANLAQAVNVSGNGVAVKIDDSSIGENVSNQLEVKDSGIATAKIADDAVTAAKVNADVAGNGLTQDGTGALQANVDNVGIEIASDALQLKDGGVTEAKLDAGVDAQTFDATHTAVNYTPSQVGTEGTAKISAHLKGIDAALTGAGATNNKELFTLAAGDITNGYVDLANIARASSINFQPANGPTQVETLDYTVSLTGGAGGNTRVTFAGDLASGGAAALEAGDVIVIQYEY